jgi:hypothetical protein
MVEQYVLSLIVKEIDLRHRIKQGSVCRMRVNTVFFLVLFLMQAAWAAQDPSVSSTLSSGVVKQQDFQRDTASNHWYGKLGFGASFGAHMSDDVHYYKGGKLKDDMKMRFEMKPGMSFDLSAGYRKNQWRSELSLGHMVIEPDAIRLEDSKGLTKDLRPTNPHDDNGLGQMQGTSLMLSQHYDVIMPGLGFAPTLFIGAGAAQMSLATGNDRYNTSTSDKKSNVMMTEYGLGLIYHRSAGAAWGVHYRQKQIYGFKFNVLGKNQKIEADESLEIQDLGVSIRYAL